ncbi:MAG TPA: arginase family protein [Anaeromyxobacteraceae bacterium]|nr:arginase family protein [Anaeromyxobacteraceae bacterium]
MQAQDELRLLLRPAGGGLYVVSTGREEQLAVQRRIYGGVSENDVARRWQEALAQARGARAFLVGVPSDVGAGFLRGANMGPQAIRERLVLEDPGFFLRAAEKGLVDAGDVFVVPQLLHDDMLSLEQREASRAALYPGLPAVSRAALPVSPLSIAERALALLLAESPGAGLLVLGGDHSCALPAVKALAAVRPALAVVQVDAHTDLLAERLGVRYCFGTWSYHANELLGRGGRLIQVGLRASRHDRSHWESTLDVRQLWADEVRADPARAADLVVDLVRRSGAQAVYFSNDIDGTDPDLARATGTPEPGGLGAEFVGGLVRRLGREVKLAGGDVMEVAPPLGGDGEPERTLALAARYLRETAAALLGEPV